MLGLSPIMTVPMMALLILKLKFAESAIKPIILTQFEASRKSDIPVFTVLDLLGGELLDKANAS